MASGTPFTLKWGIMATGWIAETFSKDLLTDPTTRDVHDVRHEIVAVASSSSKDRSVEFIEKIKGPSSAKTYGSYEELVSDPNVDIIYVATPHSHHFQNCMLALDAGKHVLCEKAFTVNAAQARKLVETAKAKNLFLMEAVWTRYFPLSIKVRELIAAGEIGSVFRTIADLSLNSNAEDDKFLSFADTHRMVNMDLAGGSTLDLGIYALTWVFQTLYHLQPEAQKEAPKVAAVANLYSKTGADENVTILCQFPQHGSIGIATASMRVATDPEGKNAFPAARIQGSKGEIQVMYPTFQPQQLKVIKNIPGPTGNGDGEPPADVQVLDFPLPKDPKRDNWGHGMYWEADECARCLRDGRVESSTLPWEESIVIMETMEETLKQVGVAYPELITTDVYDAKSPLNVGNQ